MEITLRFNRWDRLHPHNQEQGIENETAEASAATNHVLSLPVATLGRGPLRGLTYLRTRLWRRSWRISGGRSPTLSIPLPLLSAETMSTPSCDVAFDVGVGSSTTPVYLPSTLCPATLYPYSAVAYKRSATELASALSPEITLPGNKLPPGVDEGHRWLWYWVQFPQS